jgi:hypothetical protein
MKESITKMSSKKPTAKKATTKQPAVKKTALPVETTVPIVETVPVVQPIVSANKLQVNKDTIKKYFPYIIIAVLALLLTFQRACTPSSTVKGDIVKVNGKKYEVVSHEVDTIEHTHDSIVYKKGKDIYHDTTIYVPIPTHEPIDTYALLLDYFAKNVYKDSLKFPNELGYVSVIDTISKNTILARKWNLHLIERTIEDKLIVKELPRTQVYIGANLGAVKPYPMAGASIFLKNKRDQMYGVNVGYTSNLDMYAQGTLLWKISFRKKK